MKKRAEEDPTYHPLLLTTLTTPFNEISSGSCEVSPLDETALERQFSIPSSEGVRTTQLGPTMTGPTRTEDRRGLKLQRSYHRDREFPRAPKGRGTRKE